jgi:AraC family transcriptional regulator
MGVVRKKGTTDGKGGKGAHNSSAYPSGAMIEENELHRRSKKMPNELNMEVRVEDLPEVTIAYIRHVGPYAGDSELFKGLFGRLFQWAGPRNLLRFPETQILSIYHDDPHVTDEAKLRTSVGITVAGETEVSGEIGKMQMPAGRYAQARFELEPHQYEAAWNTVYGGWLPDSGYQPADGLPFERYLNNPDDHPQGKHIVEICMPVKPL